MKVVLRGYLAVPVGKWEPDDMHSTSWFVNGIEVEEGSEIPRISPGKTVRVEIPTGTLTATINSIDKETPNTVVTSCDLEWSGAYRALMVGESGGPTWCVVPRGDELTVTSLATYPTRFRIYERLQNFVPRGLGLEDREQALIGVTQSLVVANLWRHGCYDCELEAYEKSKQEEAEVWLGKY